jgi:hypothetical protein
MSKGAVKQLGEEGAWLPQPATWLQLGRPIRRSVQRSDTNLDPWQTNAVDTEITQQRCVIQCFIDRQPCLYGDTTREKCLISEKDESTAGSCWILLTALVETAVNMFGYVMCGMQPQKLQLVKVCVQISWPLASIWYTSWCECKIGLSNMTGARKNDVVTSRFVKKKKKYRQYLEQVDSLGYCRTNVIVYM